MASTSSSEGRWEAFRRVAVVYNTGARRGRKAARILRRTLPRLVPSAEVAWLTIEELDRLAPDRDLVFAAGGDGTLNAVFSCLWCRDIDVPVAIVPAGTGNNLARGLGIPTSPSAAVERFLGGPRSTKRIDALELESADGTRQLCVQGAALGFPARIAERFDRLRPWSSLIGPFSYKLLALFGLREQKRRERRGEELLEVELRLPGEEVHRETALGVFVCSEGSVGGGFVPSPDSSLTDGLFEICLIRANVGVPYLKTFAKVQTGEHLELTDAVLFLQSAGPVEIEVKGSTPLMLDGEVLRASSSYTVRVLRERFRILGQVDRQPSSGTQ